MLFKRFFDSAAAQTETDAEDSISESFAAAIAAIDRAARDHQQQCERRLAQDDRRKGGPDTRPSGSPERRNGPDRRVAPQAHGFGRRGMAV
ncbi:MAG: hypothetical protein JNL45_04530 [Hyphomicrobium sp.]|jgi:hypothetical protein|nr:hypothetical protein [Hyphomicrobium sp.]